jgi:hypothetical protein
MSFDLARLRLEANMSLRAWFFAAMVTGLGAVASASPPQAQSDLKVEGPYISGNLAVYLVCGPNLLGDKKYLTLSEGLEQKTVIVRDKRDVNELTVENQSDQDLFVQAGEIVKGGQQDRTLGQDMVLSAHSAEIPIPANCVEPGRWTQRGNEDATSFDASPNFLSSKALKESNYKGDQQAVWADAHAAQGQLAANTPGLDVAATTSPSSLELTLEDKSVTTATATYEKDLAASLQPSQNVIGFMFAINGKLNSGDAYASADLFNKMYPKLLHAAAIEALSERQPNSQGRLYDVPKAEVVQQMIEAVDAAKGEALTLDATEMEREINQQANLKSPVVASTGGNRAVIVKKQSDRMDLFETLDSQTAVAFLHRAYLTK